MLNVQVVNEKAYLKYLKFSNIIQLLSSITLFITYVKFHKVLYISVNDEKDLLQKPTQAQILKALKNAVT